MPLFTALDRLKADLDAWRPLQPEQEQRVMQALRLEWSYNSNAMEGNSLTLGETRALLLHGLTAAGKPLRDHLDISAHHAAVLWLEDFVRDESPLTEQLIRGMHKVLLGQPNGVSAPLPDGGQPARPRPGQYKASPNNVITALGTTIYFSSPEDAPARVTELLGWYRAEIAHPTLHPVALAAKLYQRFVRIHPFDDGNGRLARLLLNLVLLRHGYGIAVIKATDRARYLAALATADAGEPEPFLRFIIENVETSLRRQIRAAKGESIDEPADLEVKLTRLKQQLLSREDTVKTLWDEEVQEQVYEALIGFWLDNLNQQTQGFDDFFMTLGYVGSIDSAQPALLEEEGAVETFKSLFKAAISKTYTEIETVSFSKKWHHFRQRNNGFDVSLQVTFHFRQDHFTVSEAVVSTHVSAGLETPWEGEVLNCIYLPGYDQNRIHEINYQFATRLYDFIAAQIAELDALPT